MINKLIKTSIYKPGMVFLFTILTMIFGWFSFKSLPIDAVPDITNVQVQVNTAVNGLIPEEIEKFITYPIESEMGGIPMVDKIRSITRFGLSQVTIIFEEGSDIYLARQLVTEKLQSIQDELPKGTQPKLGPITTGLGEIYFYSLEAKEKAQGEERLKQLMDLRALNKWFITPRLLTVKGVAEVNAIGGFEKQIFVQPRMKELSRYGIHLHEVVEAIQKNNRNTGGGYVQQTSEQLLIQATGLVHSLEDIMGIVVKRLPNFKTVTIADIADVRLDKELRTGAALVNGEESVIGTILMLLGENSRTISLSVDKRMHEIKRSLPDWVNLKILYNRSDLVNETLGTVQKNLLFGAALVALILLIMIGNIRVAIITAITIPLSLLTTFILMKYFNVSGNLMSLGALDFGIIIDGAVIVMDNCVRFLVSKAKELKRNLTRDEIKEQVFKATTEIRSAAGFGQLIILLVFIPIFALTGVEAKMFIPMAAAFCFALGAAFIFSFTTIPALAGSLLSGKVSTKKSWIMGLVEKIYVPSLKVALKFKYPFIALGMGAIVLGLVLFSRLGANFLPQLDEGSIAVQFVRPTNIAIDQSVKMQEISEKMIKAFPEVKIVFSRIGTAEVATDPMGVNLSDTYILLNPKSEWPKKKTKAELIAEIKAKLEANLPGQSMIFSQPIQLRFNELLEGVRTDVALKIFGEDMDKISELTSQAAAIIKTLPGVGDAEEEIKGKSPVLRINPKMTALRKLGISKENILATVETAIGGTEAGSLYEGIMRFPIVVRLNEQDRSNIVSIEQVPVGAGENFTVPLKELADISIKQTFGDIKRESSKKRAAVMINVRGRDTASFVKEAKTVIASKLKMPPGYYIEWGGSFKNLEKAKDRLIIVVPMALLLVFIMIYMAFGSIIQTFIIFACIPMALVGGVLGLMANGLDFSISAAIGFIALSGIAVLNGVVLVSYFNTLKSRGLTGDKLILEGTIMRLRPVLMTAAGAAFGFLPMMLSTGSGAEVQRPLASVVVGGIISATLLTLIVLPVVYRILEKRMTTFNSGNH
jgi:cobalt-zinc-cadmium resistance protein CzcA